MTIYENIRKALQDQAATADDFPAANLRAYENSKFTPPASTSGTAWVAMALKPIEDKPFSVGGDQKLHRGMFLVNVFTPFNEGPAACEVLVDKIRSVFDPSGRVPADDGLVIYLDYSQRGPAIVDPEWMMIPITIGWRTYSPLT